MKYWEKPNGECGTMDDDGYVPDSVNVTEQRYNERAALQATSNPPKNDMQNLIEYAKTQGWIP